MCKGTVGYFRKLISSGIARGGAGHYGPATTATPIVSMPPPSSGGGLLLEILGILRHDDLVALGADSPTYLHLLTEAMQHGFADRARYYGDPEFVDVPIPELTCARQ